MKKSVIKLLTLLMIVSLFTGCLTSNTEMDTVSKINKMTNEEKLKYYELEMDSIRLNGSLFESYINLLYSKEYSYDRIQDVIKEFETSYSDTKISNFKLIEVCDRKFFGKTEKSSGYSYLLEKDIINYERNVCEDKHNFHFDIKEPKSK